MCGPSIGTFSASRNSAAPPTWSIWPWVSQIFSTVTPVCLIASRIFGTSPPGSITTAFLVGSCQMMVQFCSNSVTGTMIAPAFAWVSVCSVMAAQCRFLATPSKRFANRFDAPIAASRQGGVPCRCHTGVPVGPNRQAGSRVASRNGILRAMFAGWIRATRLVAARHLLSGLPTLVPGFRTATGSAISRGSSASAVFEIARRRRGLAVADLSFADGRFRLRHLRLYRHRSAVRHDGRFRCAGACRA